MAKRRARGEGTIYQNPSGLWVAQITLPSGKRKAKYSKTQKVVRDWLLNQRQSVQTGNWVEKDQITVDQFLDRYFKDIASHTLKPKTLETYEYLLRMHIKPGLGFIKLTSLRPDQIQNLYSQKLESGLSSRTVQFIHSILHKALRQALKWGLVYRNVADLVEPPAVNKKTPLTLSPSQVKLLLNAVRSDRMFPILALAIGCGLREGEVLGLHYEDIDWDAQTIHVQHAVQYLIGKGLVITQPKTDTSRRTIHIPDFAYQALKDHRDSQDRNQGLVFITANGTPYSPRNLIRYFKQSLVKAELPEIRFHDLRHTAATLLLTAGVHPKIVQEMLGHSQINLTLDTYSHVLPSMQQEASQKMDSILGDF
jgi:integrase